MKRKFYPAVWMILMALFFTFSSFATNRYVNASTGNDITGDGSSGNPWATIQHAIDNSVSTDIIHVAAGTYTEDISVPAGKALELIGEGAGYTSIIQGVARVPAASWPLADPNIEILGNGTVIHGFTIKNPAWLDGFYSSGIVIGATNVEIYENAFQVAGSDDFDDVSQGLQTYATLDISGLNIHDNTFTDLAASDAGYEGIYINKNVGVGTVTIDANTFSGDVLRAISTEASNSTISDNSITTDLAPYPTGAGGWGGYQGINITAGVAPLAVSTVAVSGNTVTGSTTADGFAYGVVVGTSATTNTFSGISIANNFVSGNTVGIRVRDDAGGVTISNNSIHTNSSYSVKNDDPALTALVANCNWWNALGSGISSLVSGNVTHATYLNKGTDSDAGDPGFQPAGTCGTVTCDDPTALEYNYEVTPAANSWSTHSGTIGSDGCAVYKATLTVGKEYTFKTGCGNGATAAFDTFIELYNSSGVWIMDDDDGCAVPASGDYSSKLIWTATGTTAYIKVRGYNSLEYGAYTLAYEYTDPVAPSCKTPPENDEEITALMLTTLGEDTWATDGPTTITSDACYIYKVNTTSGKQYTFKTGCANGATADFDTFIELYDTDGDWVDQNDDGCTEYRSTVTWTATGTVYYVKVRGFNSNEYGDFTIAYEYTTPAAGGTCKTPPENDEEITALMLTTLGEDTWGTDGPTTIASDACYIYKVNTTAGKQYTFKTGCANGATADFDTFIELYDTDGGWVDQNDDGCSEYRSTVTWTASGTVYYVKVRGFNSNEYGDFTIAYKYTTPAAGGTCKIPPDNDEEITALMLTTLGEDTWATDGSTSIASDACYIYKVNTTSGKEYTFKTGCGNGATADFDTFIELYDTDGVWEDQNDDGCTEYRSTITWTASGTVYYIKVRGFNSNAYGDFTLAYMYTTPTPGSTCKTPTEFDETLTAPTTSWQTDGPTAITSDACYVYKVSVTSGNEYTFKTGCTDGSANFDTFIELYDADGEWLTQNDDGCAVPSSGDYTSKVIWSATYTGLAYVKIRGYNSSSYGNFTFAYKYVTIGPDVALGSGEGPADGKIKVYPNPANESFMVVSQATVSFTRVILNQFTGASIAGWNLDQPATSLRIESAGLAPGVYVLSVETSEGWIRKKVSIIR